MSQQRVFQDGLRMNSTDIKTCLFGLAVALTIGLAAGAAHAQISPFKGSGPKMGAADLDIMDKAAAPLFQGESFMPGSVANWSNPASGWSGTITAKGTTKVSGLPCRVLEYYFDFPKRTDDSTYTAKWCRTKDGTWKLG